MSQVSFIPALFSPVDPNPGAFNPLVWFIGVGLIECLIDAGDSMHWSHDVKTRLKVRTKLPLRAIIRHRWASLGHMRTKASSSQLVSVINVARLEHFALSCIGGGEGTERSVCCGSCSLLRLNSTDIRKVVCDACVRDESEGRSGCFLSTPAARLAMLLWRNDEWGGRIDKDFNRILKWIMVDLYVCHCH